MINVTPENLKELKATEYKKQIVKDKKYLKKSKGVIVLNEFKFSDGKKGIALVFTKKPKEAKEAFKSFKGGGHAAAKMAYGTCETKKGEDGNTSLEISLIGGGLSPEVIAKKTAKTFTAMGVAPKLMNGSTTPENNDDTSDEPLAASASSAPQTTDSSDLATSFTAIKAFMKGGELSAINTAVKGNNVETSQLETVQQQKNTIKDWVQAYNGSDAGIKKSLGKVVGFIKESYALLSKYEAKIQSMIGGGSNSSDSSINPIKGSVGKGGTNSKEDVISLQNMLNKFGFGLKVDGDCGPVTIGAITKAQQKVGVESPDGLVEPSGFSWRKFWERLFGKKEEDKKPTPPPVEPTPTPEPETVTPEPQPVEPSKKEIAASVGKGGVNNKEDVIVVQNLLNEFGHSLLVDGDCGNKTITAIKDFQSKVVKSPRPDGRIDVGGTTWKMLRGGKLEEIELRDKHDGKYDHNRIALNLFTKGFHDDDEIDENDVQQGYIGNCYFMAAIAAVAKTNPDAIKKLIKDKGDGTFDVTLYAKGDKLALKPTIVNIKPDFPVDERGRPVYAGKGDNELWVMLLEKAYAKMNGGYDDIGEGGYIEHGLEALTGEDAKVYMIYKYDEDELLELIEDGIKDKKAMSAATNGSGEEEFTTDEGSVIYKGHAYSIESLSGKKVFLRNPWGHSHATVSMKELKKYFNHISF